MPFPHAARPLAGGGYSDEAMTRIRTGLALPGSQRLWYIGEAFRAGRSVADVFNLIKIDVWFLEQIEELILTEAEIAEQKISRIEADDLRRYKRLGFSDRRIAKLVGVKEDSVRRARHTHGAIGRASCRERVCQYV